jgi:peptide-methionine (S)-S-oxide reductase
MKIYTKISLILVFIMLIFSCKEQDTLANASQTAKKPKAKNIQIAYFAEGCFWCSEHVFQSIPGVTKVVAGFSGGDKNNPDFNKKTPNFPKHAETIQIYYDVNQINFQELVNIFFASHDPTTLNKQGSDKGEEYRSIAFYQNQTEKQIILHAIDSIAKTKKYSKPIVTEVKAFEKFYQAAQKHQDYVKKNPNDSFIQKETLPRYNKFLRNYKGKIVR